MDNIKVFIRVKPETNSNLPGIIKVQDEKSLIIETANKSDIFSFDFVGETDQEQVFKSVGKVITDNCLKGYNGTIFAYGQTGSGKTYSMQGPSTSNGDLIYEERGIIPRCFEYLFKMIERTEDRSYLCRASYYEIYNEFVYDLLDPISPCCLVREDMTKGVYVDGLTEENVHSAEHTYELLKTGARNRHVAETSMNRESSRSHSVFTLVIQSKSCDVETGNVITQESRFNLVDLAGSERQKLTSATGARLKEAGNINKSLSVLGNVINALVDNSNGITRHIHYRDSKLTFLLRDSLGGNAKTAIIATVSPVSSCYVESLSTLRFAQRAKLIKNKAVVNQQFQGNFHQMQQEILRLKTQLETIRQNTTSVDCSGNGLEIKSLLASALDNNCNLEKENNSLKERIDSLEKLTSAQSEQIRTEKMVIKFRDSMLDSLKKNKGIDDFISAEKDSLTHQVESLKKQLENNPEIVRLVSEIQKLKLVNTEMKDYREYVLNLEAKMTNILQENISLLKRNNKEILLENNATVMKHRKVDPDFIINESFMDFAGLDEEIYITNEKPPELFELKHSERSRIYSVAPSIFKQKEDIPENDLLESDGNTQHLENANKELEQENERLESLLLKKESESKRLEKEIEELRSTYQSALMEMDEMRSTLEVERTSFSEKFEKLTVDQNNLNLLQTSLKEMEHKLKIQEDENERLSKSLVDFDGSKMELILSSRNAEALNGEVLKLRDQNSKYECTINELSLDNEQNFKKLLDLEQEFSKLGSLYSSLVIKSNEDMVIYRKKNSDYEQKMSNAANEIDQLQDKVDKFLNQYAELVHKTSIEKLEYSETTDKLIASEADLARQTFEFSQFKEKSKEEITKLNNEYDILSKALEDKNLLIDFFETKLKNNEEVVSNFVKTCGSAITVLDAKIAEMDSRIQELLCDNQKLSDQNEVFSERISDIQEELDMEEKEMILGQEKARLQEISNILASLVKEEETIEKQLEFLCKRNESLEEENANLIKHNNLKQKVQYHLQIKEENNLLRLENQRLLSELNKRQIEIPLKETSIPLEQKRKRGRPKKVTEIPENE